MLKIVKPQIYFRNKLILMRLWSSSIVKEGVEFFNDASLNWWDPNGSMKQMHLIHPHQIAFVQDQLRLKDGVRPEATPQQPLIGYKIADIGCGVGMNCERLALLGAEVTGIDPAESAISVAKAHAASNLKLEKNLQYIVSTVEDHLLTHREQYDAINVFFVLELVRERQEFVDNCLALLKPKGSLFISHSNKSFILFCYIFWQKYVTGLYHKSLPIPPRIFLTNDEMFKLVTRGHQCELKGQRNYYWTLDGQSCRVTKSKKVVDFSHYVKVT